MMKRRVILRVGRAAVAFAGLHSFHVVAQGKYRNKPITLVCPYAEGDNSDQRCRQFGQFLSVALGQPVIVDNKPGAGGNLGTELIAQARPDGYTLGMGNFAPLAVNRHRFFNMGFDPIKDLVPVCVIERGPLVLMVPMSSPFRTVKDVSAAAKSEPGKLTVASGGIGGSHRLCGEMFKAAATVVITHVPHKGGGSTEFFSAFIAAESNRGSKLIRASNIKAELSTRVT